MRMWMRIRMSKKKGRRLMKIRMWMKVMMSMKKGRRGMKMRMWMKRMMISMKKGSRLMYGGNECTAVVVNGCMSG